MVAEPSATNGVAVETTSPIIAQSVHEAITEDQTSVGNMSFTQQMSFASANFTTSILAVEIEIVA